MGTPGGQSGLAVMSSPAETAQTSPAGSVDAGQGKLRALMEAEPFGFRFVQMVRLLEKLHPECKPVGMFVSPEDEVVRFTAVPTLAFPASELGALASTDLQPASLEVNFLGLNVVNGPMPRTYTEALLERRQARDNATLEFFDLFNHRLVSLFYRAWSRYRFYIAYEKAGDGEGEVTQRLYDLIGMGTPHLRGRMAIADESALFYAGLLSGGTRPVEGLRQILTSYFGVPVEIRQFTGTWVQLPAAQRTRLYETATPAASLGIGTVVGHEVWDQQGTLTVRLGPMPLRQYREFLPGSNGQAELRDWLALYSRRGFDFLVQLILQREEVPPTALDPCAETHVRLGYESWLKTKPMRRDPDETTYLLR